MNYVGRGALVTFAQSDAAESAIQGAMMGNGRLLKGQHPVSELPAKRGRGFNEDLPQRSSLGRHNMEDDDIDAIDRSNKKPKKQARQYDDGDEEQDDEEPQTQRRFSSSNNNHDDEDMSEDFDDDQEGNAMDEDDDNGDYGAQDDEDDFDDPVPTPPAPKLPKSPRQSSGSLQVPSSIAENARSSLLQWQPVAGKKKAANNFSRFGNASAMDVDAAAEHSEEETLSRAPSRNRFASFDPTKNQPISAVPGVFKTLASSRSTTGPPAAIGREIASRLAAQQSSHDSHDEYDEDGAEEAADDQQTDENVAHNGLGKRFSSNGNDSDDFDSGSEAGGDAGDDDSPEADEPEVDSAQHSEQEDGDMEVDEDGNDEDHDASDAEDSPSRDSSSSPEPSASSHSMKVDVKPVVRRPSPLASAPNSIAALSKILNPQCNPGKLAATFDPDKQHWHPLLELEDEKRAVGSFQRPAGGDDIPPPERVRTVPWLYKSLIKAEKNAADAETSNSAPRLEIYNYLCNRFRQILKELTQQSTMCLLSCYIAETIARRTLPMRAEVLLETPHVDLSTFNTGREKVLDNAFEMCKNLYALYNQLGMRAPFSNEILSYYLMYRFQHDGISPAWTTILDSLASVYTRPGARRSSPEYTSFLASLRCDPHIDFVTRIAEILSSYNWRALRSLVEKATFLQLCSISDLLPEFVYFAVDHFCTTTMKATRPSLPSSFLQYNFFLRHDQFTTHLPEAYAAEPVVVPKGNSLAIASHDPFYPLPSATASTPRGIKKKGSSKGGETYLPTDQSVWRAERDEIMKLLSSIAPTFMYRTNADPAVDSSVAWQVYQHWADSDLFEIDDGPLSATFDGADDEVESKNLASYVIPSNPSAVSPLYEHILDLHFAGGTHKQAPKLAAAPSILGSTTGLKSFPPPPKRSAATIVPATVPKISVSPPPSATAPSEPDMTPQHKPFATVAVAPAVKLVEPVTVPSVGPPSAPRKIPAAAPSSTTQASGPASTVLAPAAIPAAFEARVKDLEKKLAQFAQKELQMEQKNARMEEEIANLRDTEAKLNKYQEKYAALQARNSSRVTAEDTIPAKLDEPSFVTFGAVAPIELPSIVSAGLLCRQVLDLPAGDFPPQALSFKLAVSISPSLHQGAGTIEHWLESKLSYPGSSIPQDDSPHIKTLSSIGTDLDLSPNNPFVADIAPPEVLQAYAEEGLLLASAIKSIATAALPTDGEVERAALKGTNFVLFFVPSTVPSSEFWHAQRLRLDHTLHLLPERHQIALSVLYCPGAEPIAEETVRECLGLSDASTTPLRIAVTQFTALDGSLIDFTTTLGHLQATERLEHIIRDLSLMAFPEVPRTTATLKQLLEPYTDEILQTAYRQYRQTLQEAKLSLPFASIPAPKDDALAIPSLPLPSSLAYDWNSLLGSVWRSLIKDDLPSVNWPAPETLRLFPHLSSAFGWPDSSWNSPSSLDHLSQFIQSFIIDDSAAQSALEGANLSTPDCDSFDFDMVCHYVTALIQSHPRLEGFDSYAPAALMLFKDRLTTAQAMARKTNFIPVQLPFSWHTLFESLFSFLLEQMSDELACLEVSALPFTVRSPDADRKWKMARRDRQQSEANTWTSWYQNLCASIEDIRKEEFSRLESSKNPQRQFSALLDQFSASSSPIPRGLSFAVPESPSTRTQRNGTSYETPSMRATISTSTATMSPPPFSLDPATPRTLKPSSMLSPQGRSPSTGRTYATSPSAVDSLHDRLKSLQDRLQLMTDSSAPRANTSHPKRKAEDSGYAMEPPEAKRKSD